jgi:hypothetical protein
MCSVAYVSLHSSNGRLGHDSFCEMDFEDKINLLSAKLIAIQDTRT